MADHRSAAVAQMKLATIIRSSPRQVLQAKHAALIQCAEVPRLPTTRAAGEAIDPTAPLQMKSAGGHPRPAVLTPLDELGPNAGS